jgi:apolipoprotein N-acyltransferase
LLAIEEGLPLVRAANTGVSAVIDPLGRIVGSLPLGSAGTLDSALPRPIAATIYARIGDLWLWLVIAAIFAAALATRVRK